jgi:hypothetical protein
MNMTAEFGRMGMGETSDLSLYYAEIAAVEGEPGRDHIAPQLLISLWLYAYSRGVSSAREVARQCGFEPGFAPAKIRVLLEGHQLSDLDKFQLRPSIAIAGRRQLDRMST